MIKILSTLVCFNTRNHQKHLLYVLFYFLEDDRDKVHVNDISVPVLF